MEHQRQHVWKLIEKDIAWTLDRINGKRIEHAWEMDAKNVWTMNGKWMEHREINANQKNK